MATEKYTNVHFSERLTSLVRLDGRTQKAIAQEAKITESGLSKYMKGQRFPKWEEARRLAAVFCMPVELFLQGDAEHVEGAPSADEMAETEGSYGINWRLRAQNAEERLARIRKTLEGRRDLFAELLKTEFENYDV